MLRAAFLALLLAACAAAPATAPEIADADPVWGRVDWTRLRGVQVLLGNRLYADALRLAGALPDEGLSAPERMWLAIYRGIALDGVGRRAEAVQAYEAAAAIHRHPVVEAGLKAPLASLRHLDRVAHGER